MRDERYWVQPGEEKAVGGSRRRGGYIEYRFGATSSGVPSGGGLAFKNCRRAVGSGGDVTGGGAEEAGMG